MELSFTASPEPVNAPRPEQGHAPRSYPADLFEACNVDARRAKAPAPGKSEAPPSAANDEVGGETLTLLAIVDFLIDLWRKESGEDLRAAIFPPQNL